MIANNERKSAGLGPIMLLPILLAIGFLAVAVGIYAFALEPAWLRVRRRTLILDAWDPSLDGLTILHLSDLHIGRSNRRLARFVRSASQLQADVVVVTGDFVHRAQSADAVHGVLGDLTNNRLVLGVPGNHDLYDYSPRWPSAGKDPSRRSAVLEVLRAAGITMLLDTALSVATPKGVVTFAGVTYPFGRPGRLTAILNGTAQPRGSVLLSHSPDILEEASQHTVPLVLCGHTHGGQVRFGPWFTPTTATVFPLDRPYGLLSRRQTLMHISPGLGTTFLPVRFFARPEITLLELRSAAAPPTTA